MRAVDWYSGAGGASLGLSRAGFDVYLGFDYDPMARNMYSQFVGREAINEDLGSVKAIREVASRHGIRPSFRDVMWFSTPCTKVSSAATMFYPDAEDNIALFEESLSFAIENYLHAWLMFENPGRIATSAVYEPMRNRINAVSMKYRKTLVFVPTFLRPILMNASQVGLPQDRERVIGVVPPKGWKSAIQYRKPKVEPQTLRSLAGIKDCCPFSFSLSAKESVYLAIKPGENWRQLLDFFQRNKIRQPDWFKQELKRRRRANPPPSFARRITLDELAPTIVAAPRVWIKQGNFIHPTANRKFTMGEQAFMQGLPLDFYVPDAENRLYEIQRFIGNAVPPAMAEARARDLLEEISACKRRKTV